MLAQFRENYRGSPISVEAGPRSTARPRAGDRMPDGTVTTAEWRRVRLHLLTAQPGLHVLLPAATAMSHPPRSGPLLHVHRLAGTPGSDILAVRPDGYVGFRGPSTGGLDSWLTRVRVARSPV